MCQTRMRTTSQPLASCKSKSYLNKNAAASAGVLMDGLPTVVITDSHSMNRASLSEFLLFCKHLQRAIVVALFFFRKEKGKRKYVWNERRTKR